MDGTLGHYRLLGSSDDEARLLVHESSGFTSPLPGFPSMDQQGEGFAEVSAGHGRIQVTARYGIGAEGTTLESEVLTILGEAAEERAANVPELSLLAPGERGDGVEVAGATIFPRKAPAGAGPMEYVTVYGKTHGDRAATHTLSLVFDTRDLNAIVWPHVRCALAGKQDWSPEQPRAVCPALWPESSRFAELDMRLKLLPDQVEETYAKARALSVIAPGGGADLVDLIVQFARTPDPPTFKLHPFILETGAKQLRMRTPTDEVHEALTRNLTDVETTHDLRAWCWQCLYAFEIRHQELPGGA